MEFSRVLCEHMVSKIAVCHSDPVLREKNLSFPGTRTQRDSSVAAATSE